MIKKSDCMSILACLNTQDKKEVNKYLKILVSAPDDQVPFEVLKFIANSRGLEVAKFYEMLRQSHNKKKSPLYTNILSGESDPIKTATTLSCFLTQVLLYSRKLDEQDAQIFYEMTRTAEITKVLNVYFETGIYEECTTLLKLIKADLIVLEYINGRRELEEE